MHKSIAVDGECFGPPRSDVRRRGSITTRAPMAATASTCLCFGATPLAAPLRNFMDDVGDIPQFAVTACRGAACGATVLAGARRVGDIDPGVGLNRSHQGR